MAAGQELQVQEKREFQKSDETTIPTRFFLPAADIFETEEALTVVLEMPGVAKEMIDVKVENDVLSIDGRIEFSKYEKLQPVYTEYNVGHFRRRFTLSPSRIDHSRISAEMKDGVLALILPKAEQAKPRKIPIN